MQTKAKESKDGFSRRHFMKAVAGVSAAAALQGAPRVILAQGSAKGSAAGGDTIRVGLIGCGRRGVGAAENCVEAAEGVQIVALGDLFRDKLDETLKTLKEKIGDRLKVTPDTCFTGFDAYQKVIACDVDLVILAVPPHFRPAHLKAAIEAGKHVFAEKPVAVDPVGVRSIIATSELAERKKLCIVAGTQRRHQAHYLEIMKRIRDGAIGEIVAGQCYWVDDYKYYTAVLREVKWSDMEWQIRNWNSFTWLSGDHVVEQHVHNIDVINWALQGPPVQCLGMGGRQQRTAPEYGHIYDHFSVDFDYPNGVRVSSLCRQMTGCSRRVSERIVGTKGSAYLDGKTGKITGQNPYVYEGEAKSPYVQEHIDLIAAIRAGQPLNEGRAVAESTLTAIMGRMSAYTGNELSWKWVMNASKLDLTPPKYEFGDLPVEPVAVPGVTSLI